MEIANSAASDAGSARPLMTGPHLKQGDRIGSRFVIEQRLRNDVLGELYRATDEKTGKPIAILLMDEGVGTGEDLSNELRRSVKRATGLAHKNIAGVYGLGKEGGRRYVARAFVDGQNLATLLAKKAAAGKYFTLKGSYNLIAHVCNGLQYARESMPHGLLRPSSILINRSGRVKLADLGLAVLRPLVLARRDVLGPWDAPCLAVGQGAGTGADDLRALGVLLYQLLVGQPAPPELPNLPPAAAKRLPPSAGGLIERCFQPPQAGGFADPNELKIEFLQVIDEVRGTKRSPGRQAADTTARTPTVPEARAGETADHTVPEPAVPPPPPAGAMRAAQPPTLPDAPGLGPKQKGFVIPDLKKAVEAIDDDVQLRWLVERDGVDYGPYTAKQVIEQLFDESLQTQSVLFDIETELRQPFAEFEQFEEVMVAWVHEKAKREKQRSEEARARRVRRRNQITVGGILFLVLTLGGAGGGYAWYQANLPDPVPGRLPTLVSKIQGSLPAIVFQEEAPETLAEKVERKRKHRRAVAARVAAVDRARVLREARQAQESNLNLTGAGAGQAFNRAALNGIIAAHQGAITKCLTDEARRDPSRSKIHIQITALPATGALINVRMKRGTAAGTACVRGVLAGQKVPPFGGTNVKVVLPYTIRK